MQPVDTKEISKRLKLFKNVDPHMYGQLLVLCDQRVTERMHEVASAPPDQILVAQGRAQEALAWLRIMSELPEEDPPQPRSPSP